MGPVSRGLSHTSLLFFPFITRIMEACRIKSYIKGKDAKSNHLDTPYWTSIQPIPFGKIQKAGTVTF